jgi:phosphomannomutase
MITGSFLPPNRNGMKFFTSAGGFNKEDIADLLCDASTLTSRMNTPPKAQRADIISLYINDLREKICREVNAENKEKPLDGLRVVVDASNGVGGFFVDRVLAPLGADTSGSLFLEPDGAFPNHVPNPEDKKAMAALCEATLAANAAWRHLRPGRRPHVGRALRRRSDSARLADCPGGGHYRPGVSGRHHSHRLGHLRPPDVVSGGLSAF